MNSKEMVKIAYEALSDKKGQDIKIIDIQSVSVLADYFIIADGSNPNQVQAMADNVEEMLGKAGCECKQIEGYQSANCSANLGANSPKASLPAVCLTAMAHTSLPI